MVSAAKLHGLTLAFDNPAVEKAYAAHRRSTAASADRFKQMFVGVVSVINLTIAAYVSVSANPLRVRLLRALGPHSVVYGCQVAVSQCSWYKHRRTACVVLFEVLYILIALPNIPKVVSSAPTSLRAYAKTFIMGSGAILPLWYSAFSDKPWRFDLVMLPLEYLAVAWFMTPPTCSALIGNELGRNSTLQLLGGLRSSRAILQQRLLVQLDAPRCACYAMMWVWDALWCALTMYGRYRLDLKRRMAFSPSAVNGWPMTPSVMHVVLHFAVACVGMSWLVL